MTSKTTKFETGSVYEMRFIGDSELKVKWICTKLTAKNATFQKFEGSEKITKKIRTYNNVDYILQGSYSMAPSIHADRIVS
tara:strand:- start:1063 stop:1305 length:243 start_codon:yes stop_codon:yes gene_type:complete